MTDHTPDDAPGKNPPENSIDTSVAPQFPEQEYRDRSASPKSDDSDSVPKRSVAGGPKNEPSETDPSAGPVQPFFVDPSRLIPNPFRPPPPGPPGVNPFAGLPVPPQPERGRRSSRSRTTQGLSPPSRPPTRGPAARGRSNTAQADESACRASVSPAPRRPSVRRPVKEESSNSAQGGTTTDPVPPSAKASSTAKVSDSAPSGVKGEKMKRVPRSHQRKSVPKKNDRAAPRRQRDATVAGPARYTRGRGERVEFGFDDLDRLVRRRREEMREKGKGKEKGKGV